MRLVLVGIGWQLGHVEGVQTIEFGGVHTCLAHLKGNASFRCYKPAHCTHVHGAHVQKRLVDIVQIVGNPFLCHVSCYVVQLDKAVFQFAVVFSAAGVQAYASNGRQI